MRLVSAMLLGDLAVFVRRACKGRMHPALQPLARTPLETSLEVRAIAGDIVDDICKSARDIFRFLTLVSIELAAALTSPACLTSVCPTKSILSQASAFDAVALFALEWQETVGPAVLAETTRQGAIAAARLAVRQLIKTSAGLNEEAAGPVFYHKTIKRHFTARKTGGLRTPLQETPLAVDAPLVIRCDALSMQVLRCAVKHPTPHGFFQAVFGARNVKTVSMQRYRDVLDAAIATAAVCGAHCIQTIGPLDAHPRAPGNHPSQLWPQSRIAWCSRCGLAVGYPSEASAARKKRAGRKKKGARKKKDESLFVTPGPGRHAICRHCLLRDKVSLVSLVGCALRVARERPAAREFYSACVRCGRIDHVTKDTFRWSESDGGLVCTSQTCIAQEHRSVLFFEKGAAAPESRPLCCEIKLCPNSVRARARSGMSMFVMVDAEPNGGPIATPICLCATHAAQARFAAGHEFVLPRGMFAFDVDNPAPKPIGRKRKAQGPKLARKRARF